MFKTATLLLIAALVSDQASALKLGCPSCPKKTTLTQTSERGWGYQEGEEWNDEWDQSHSGDLEADGDGDLDEVADEGNFAQVAS